MGLESMSGAEIPGIANPIMDNLMDASIAIDHERHIRDFTDRMKSTVTKEYLARVPGTVYRSPVIAGNERKAASPAVGPAFPQSS